MQVQEKTDGFSRFTQISKLPFLLLQTISCGSSFAIGNREGQMSFFLNPDLNITMCKCEEEHLVFKKKV